MSKIMACDIECFGVSDKFICGTFTTRNKKGEIEHITKTNKQEFEQWIIDYAKTQKQRIDLYHHNVGYDLFRYADITNKLADTPNGKEGYKPFSLTRKPMIDYLDNKGNVIIRYLDTYKLINKSLADIGKQIGYEKLEPNEKLQQKYKQDKEQKLTNEEIQELIKYNQRDSEICLRIVEFIQEQLKKEDYKPDQIITIGQLAIGLFNKRLKRLGMKWTMFEWIENPKERKTKFDEYHQTKYPEEIRQAYKTGRIEAFQTGTHQNCTNIDYNSLFPKAMIEMPFPNIKKEKYIENPLQYFREQEILNTIGISSCTIKCPKQEIGYLPIRIKFGTKKSKESKEDDTHIEETIYPNHECILEGTWTNFELKKAIELGYKIETIHHTIAYAPITDEESPLKRFLLECYEKRKKGPLENFFYKYIMNNLHGKFAQRITEGEYLIENVSDSIIKDRTEEGYQIKMRIGFNYVYTKETGKTYARNFAPIISAYTTAYARDMIYEDIKKIPLEDLLYVATDGIVFKGNHLNKFKIGKEIGEYKIVEKEGKKLENVETTIWGKNNYKVGEDIRISGVHKEITKNMTKEDFEKPFQYWKFPTIDQVATIEEMFKRKYEEKDLEKVKTKTEGLKEFIKTMPRIRDATTNRDD